MTGREGFGLAIRIAGHALPTCARAFISGIGFIVFCGVGWLIAGCFCSLRVLGVSTKWVTGLIGHFG